jgi:hypothetical protein
MSEEKIIEHFKECRPTIDNACAALASAQSKLKRNMVLLRQVKSLSKTELVFKKNNQSFKVAGEAGGMSKTTPFLSFWIVAWNLSPHISFFLMLTRSLTNTCTVNIRCAVPNRCCHLELHERPKMDIRYTNSPRACYSQ